MVEPFKNLFNRELIRAMARHLGRVHKQFDSDGFYDFASDHLDDLELKERSNQICNALEKHLPEDFQVAARILVASLEPSREFSISEMEAGSTDKGIRGWAVMPMANFIARRGMDHVDLSLEALREMTSRSSSEFAIRPFLIYHQHATLKTMHAWIKDPNEHVRRLVSEGTRPRLPWGMRLNEFVKDPSPILPLLENLKDDPSEYVRRSVANNLNDIAKDHGDLVAGIGNEWMKNASVDRARLIRHALRTLIKNGHSGALKALGYGPAKVSIDRLEVMTPEVTLGNALSFELDLTSTSGSDQPLIIDYDVHHMRANGKTSPKVFKWKNVTLKSGGRLSAKRKHAIRPITTRRYYPGRHKLEILVNGKAFGDAVFELVIK